MAPTEVLARQHAANLARLLAAAGPRGGAADRQGARRRPARAPWPRLATGQPAIAVGTHALFQDGVAFQDLGAGGDRRAAPVRCRATARPRGQGPGRRRPPDDRDADPAQPGAGGATGISPPPSCGPGRPAGTRSSPARCQTSGSRKCSTPTERALGRGERIYWICPVVEGGEENTAMAAVERHGLLAERFGNAVGLVHGRLRCAGQGSGS